MTFNGDKFELIRYGKRVIDPVSFSQPDGVPIREVPEVKDLGVLMSQSATFESEIEKNVVKSNRQAGWVLRVFRTREQEPMMSDDAI